MLENEKQGLAVPSSVDLSSSGEVSELKEAA